MMPAAGELRCPGARVCLAGGAWLAHDGPGDLLVGLDRLGDRRHAGRLGDGPDHAGAVLGFGPAMLVGPHVVVGLAGLAHGADGPRSGVVAAGKGAGGGQCQAQGKGAAPDERAGDRHGIGLLVCWPRRCLRRCEECGRGRCLLRCTMGIVW